MKLSVVYNWLLVGRLVADSVHCALWLNFMYFLMICFKNGKKRVGEKTQAQFHKKQEMILIGKTIALYIRQPNKVNSCIVKGICNVDI